MGDVTVTSTPSGDGSGWSCGIQRVSRTRTPVRRPGRSRTDRRCRRCRTRRRSGRGTALRCGGRRCRAGPRRADRGFPARAGRQIGRARVLDGGPRPDVPLNVLGRSQPPARRCRPVPRSPRSARRLPACGPSRAPRGAPHRRAGRRRTGRQRAAGGNTLSRNPSTRETHRWPRPTVGDVNHHRGGWHRG